MPVAAVYSAGIVGWRIHAGTKEGPLLSVYTFAQRSHPLSPRRPRKSALGDSSEGVLPSASP